MTNKEATLVVKAMEGNIPYFPRDEAAQALIVRELVSLGATLEQGMWLARRYAQLYDQWKFRELRAVFCSRFKPAEGPDTTSSVYLDGIPSEKPAVMQPRIGPPEHEEGRKLIEGLMRSTELPK